MTPTARLGVLVVVGLVAGRSMAFTGNDLWQSAGPMDDLAFMSYVRGVADASRLSDAGFPWAVDGVGAATKYCLPRGADFLQAADIVRNFLRDSPQLRHMPAVTLVDRALRDAWPCG